MAEGKSSFIFYTDWYETFKNLPKDKGYDLLIHVLAYVNDENPETEDPIINAVFPLIKNTLKRDLKKWDNYIGKQRENGKKGGRPKKPKEPIKPKPYLENPTEPKKADSVSVNVTVNVTEIGADPNTQQFYDMLVPEIIEVWIRENPGYHLNKTLDYHAALKISYQIAQIKKWKKADVLEEKKDECVIAWVKIAKFIMSNSWFSKMTLDSIAGDKIWQKIVVEMASNKNGNGKMEDADYMVKAREDYLKNRQ